MSALHLEDVSFVVRVVHVPCQVEETQVHHTMALDIRKNKFEAMPVELIPAAVARVGMVAAQFPRPSALRLGKSPQGLWQGRQSSVAAL